MSRQTDIHNKIAGEIVKSIVRPPIEAGGKTSDVLVLLESVVVGVIMACGKIDGWDVHGRDTMLMTLEDSVRNRLIEMAVKEGLR